MLRRSRDGSTRCSAAWAYRFRPIWWHRYAGTTEHDWSAEFHGLYSKLDKEGEEERRKSEGQRVAGTAPSLPIEKYAGTYTDPLYGTVTVSAESGRLRIRYGDAFVGALEHWHYDTFRAVWDASWRQPALATFRLDAAGRAAALEMMGERFTAERD